LTNNSKIEQYEVCAMYLRLFGETGSGNMWNIGSGNCRKWNCMICVIEMSGLMFGSMPEVVQQAEMALLTLYRPSSSGKCGQTQTAYQIQTRELWHDSYLTQNDCSYCL